jgi:hypothetical protein
MVVPSSSAEARCPDDLDALSSAPTSSSKVDPAAPRERRQALGISVALGYYGAPR